MIIKPNSKINILSWNIQSSNTVSGSKFDDTVFRNTLENHQIICLQETRQNVKYPGYRAFNNTRSNEKNGGVCTLIKNNFCDGVVKITTSIPDIVVCKLKRSFFNLNSDIFIINTYIKPANSSSKNSENSGYDNLYDLEILINNLQRTGNIILCGDFNARISNEPDFIQHDTDSTDTFIPLPDDYIPDNLLKRNSQDLKTNSYKRSFLDLLINNKIHILNGRTLGDFRGHFTCIQPTGSSVIDYFATSAEINKLVNHLTIMPFTIFSDHRPVSLSLTFNKFTSHNNANKVYDKAPVRYKFCENNKEAYRDLQDSEDMKGIADNITNNSYCDSIDGTYELNNDFTTYLQGVADKTLTKTKIPTDNITNKKPWFNKDCRSGKRLATKAARIVSRFPNSDYLRKNFYLVKKRYKSILKTNKSQYFDKLNQDIEQGKVLNWKQFRRLKEQKSQKLKFDGLDMNNFETFFQNLYSNEHPTISKEQKEELLLEADRLNVTTDPPSMTLNDHISLEEIRVAIKSLKTGKGSSSDLICNELLINLNSNGTIILQKLFNKCLDTGSYPWNNSIISPLHKKGNKEDPDNYRAIAVSSTIGKLFSTILLDRLIAFRNNKCPDPPNQLGFTKGAQTYDHILTLNTITSKYKKLRKKVHAVFVDFKKAFDSVCREALFYKLSKMGVTGKFYNVLRHMYGNSTAQIKLSGHVSKTILTRKGTEQGHPLSPDLFKIFLSDLSPSLEFSNCPELMNCIISHLLWADDLIILALGRKTLQKQLDALHAFCTQWGIEININKTKLMTFNKGKWTPDDSRFNIGNMILEEVDTYTYLGITIHNSGSFTHARQDLREKATRALYALKNTVNKTKLTFRSLCTLFDSLIKPIVLYGAPIWCPSMSAIKNLCKILTTPVENNGHANWLRKISGLLDCEKVHLHFLKWALGVNRRASNVGSWGETGRYPLIYECLNLTIKYVKRLQSKNENSFVGLAFKEQQKLNLAWYNNIEPILKTDESYVTNHVTLYKKINHSLFVSSDSHHQNTPQKHFVIYKGVPKLIPPQSIKPIISRHFTPHIVMKSLKSHFREAWQHCKNSSPKMEFYNRVKDGFCREKYLDYVTNFYDRANLTKLRVSAHELHVETGRHKNIPRQDRHCKWCKLSMGIDTIEDEDHFLYTCDLYSQIRAKTVTMISELTNINVAGTNYMLLLCQINKLSTTNTQSTSYASHSMTHPYELDLDHQSAVNLSSKLSTDSAAASVSRTIAKNVTLSFERRKQLSSSTD